MTTTVAYKDFFAFFPSWICQASGFVLPKASLSDFQVLAITLAMQNTGLLKACWKFTMYNVLPFQSLAGQAEMPSWLPLLFGCTNTFRLWHTQVRQNFKSSLRWKRALPSIQLVALAFGRYLILWDLFSPSVKTGRLEVIRGILLPGITLLLYNS